MGHRQQVSQQIHNKSTTNPQRLQLHSLLYSKSITNCEFGFNKYIGRSWSVSFCIWLRHNVWHRNVLVRARPSSTSSTDSASTPTTHITSAHPSPLQPCAPGPFLAAFQAFQGQLSLAIPPWVGTMSRPTGDGHGHH